MVWIRNATTGSFTGGLVASQRAFEKKLDPGGSDLIYGPWWIQGGIDGKWGLVGRCRSWGNILGALSCLGSFLYCFLCFLVAMTKLLWFTTSLHHDRSRNTAPHLPVMMWAKIVVSPLKLYQVPVLRVCPCPCTHTHITKPLGVWSIQVDDWLQLNNYQARPEQHQLRWRECPWPTGKQMKTTHTGNRGLWTSVHFPSDNTSILL